MLKALFRAVIVTAALAGASLAQETPNQFALELNALQSAETGCRVSFLATNQLGSTLDKASLELALFNRSGAIEKIVTLDFKALTDGKTKVLQFLLANLSCENIGRILINDVTACEGADIAATACLAGLKTSALPDVTFGI
jgi:hypothetical protein